MHYILHTEEPPNKGHIGDNINSCNCLEVNHLNNVLCPIVERSFIISVYLVVSMVLKHPIIVSFQFGMAPLTGTVP